MDIRTQQSLSGFIASDPQLTLTDRGDARFYARIGQEHYRRNDDGSYTKLDTTFHDLVAFRRAADSAHGHLYKGDHFIAEGYLRSYTRHLDGQPQPREEFVAKKLGHDSARGPYTTDPAPRRDASPQALESPAPAAPATGPQPPAPSLERAPYARPASPLSR